MIDELIAQENYEAALELLAKETGDDALYKTLICRMGLKDYAKACELAAKLVKEPNNRRYYDVFSLYIGALIKCGREDEALTLLDEELKMPFVPAQYLTSFETTRDNLKRKKKEGKFSCSPYDLYSDEKLARFMVEAATVADFIPLIKQMERRNVRNFLAPLEVLLMNKELPAYFKTMILQVLKEQNITQEFVYGRDDGDYRVVPVELEDFLEQDIYLYCRRYIAEKLTPENVSLAEVARNISLVVFMGLYPFPIREDDYDYWIIAVEYIGRKALNIPIDVRELADKHRLDLAKLRRFIQQATVLNAVV